MTLLSQEVLGLLDGVSQQPDKQRATSEFQAQFNVLDSLPHGKVKRPPTQHVAKISSTPWARQGQDGAWLWPINRDSSEKYNVIIVDGVIKVIDGFTGLEYTVLTPYGTDYLVLNDPPTYSNVTPATPLQWGFRFTQVQDTTFITNQTVTVEPDRTQSTPIRYPEALIYISQADYGTTYSITLNGTNIGYTTPAPTAPQAREQLTTDAICSALASEIDNAEQISGQFTLTIFGSTIYLTRVDHSDFTLVVSDGLADTAIIAVKGSVQLQTDLPGRALNGFVATVSPDPENKYDATYWVYDDLGTPAQNGIWRECAKPGILTTIDKTTMPWQLTKSGDVVSGFPADGGPTNTPSEVGFDPIAHPLAVSSTIPSGGSTGVSAALTVGDHAHGGTYDSLTGNGNSQTQVSIQFDMDNTNLPAGEWTTVQVSDTQGKSTSAVFYGGAAFLDQTLVYTTPLTDADVITIELFYSRGDTPPTDHQALLTVYASNASPVGVTLEVPGGTELIFSTLQEYPQGVTYTVVAGSGSIETHTITPGSDLSAQQLANAFAALSWTHFTATAPSGENALALVPADGYEADATFSTNWDQTKDYHNGSLALTVNSLVGYVITDLTTGASGTVTSNTSTTITVGGGLSGGSRDTFLDGDLVSVVSGTGDLYFVFQPINWSPRGVGDDETNPFPSFTYQYISEVGFTSGRLMMTAGENLVMSGASDVFDFFRTSVVTLLDSDRIDIQGNSDMVSDWHSIVHWAEGCWLWAGSLQAILPTDPALTNSTVSIQSQTKYQSSPALRPLAMDRRVYFCRERTGDFPVTQVFEYQRIRFPFQGFIATEETKKIPTYLLGSPLIIVGDPTLEMLFVLTDATPNAFYAYVFHYNPDTQNREQDSWSTWHFDPRATILGMDLLDGIMWFIISRPDGVFLEKMDTQVQLYDEL